MGVGLQLSSNAHATSINEVKPEYCRLSRGEEEVNTQNWSLSLSQAWKLTSLLLVIA